MIAFIDTEIGVEDKKIHDIGAIRSDGATFHASSLRDFTAFISDADFICGHNIIHHDLHYINSAVDHAISIPAIDTLYLSPLLFPKNPYHSLLKDDKLITEELNNPVNDSRKAEKLFYDEVNAFNALPSFLKQIFCITLYSQIEFKAFFDYVDCRPRIFQPSITNLVRNNFSGKVCANADIHSLFRDNPVELAYALALIWVDDSFSITPPWLLKTFPKIENVFKVLHFLHCYYRFPQLK